MTQKELEQEIKRKEDEIKALLELKDLVFDYERQIGLRLADLSKLYKQRKTKKSSPKGGGSLNNINIRIWSILKN